MTYNLLNGVRVIESSAFIAAPMGGLTLAQYGADVIRVEMIGGGIDYLRWPVAPSGRSLYWTGLNKGKRSIAIDLRKPQGRELVAALASSPQSGILLTNVAAPWLTHASLAAKRPDMITCIIEGNPDGTTAVDYTVNSATGYPFVTGEGGADAPVNHVLPAWDIACAMQGAFAVLAAYMRRMATGVGAEIRISLADIAFSAMSHLGVLADAELFDEERPAIGNYIYGSFGRDFACADGERVMVAAISSRQWQSLVDACDCAEALAAVEQKMGLALSVEADRYAAREEIAEVVGGWIGARNLADVATGFDAAGVCWGRYRTARGLVADDWRVSTENPVFSRIETPGIGEHLAAGPTARFADLARGAIAPAPLLGQHTDAVLSDVLGLSGEAIGKLHDTGIVAGPERDPDLFEESFVMSNPAEGSVVAQTSRALEAATQFVSQIEQKVASLCLRNGALDTAVLDRHQTEAHGFAWMASYLEILKATRDWAKDLDASGKLGRLPTLLLQIGFGEYLAQLGHGIAMSQDEIVRPDRFGLGAEARAFLDDADVGALCAINVNARPELVALLRQAGPAAVVDASDANDETAALIRGQFRAFADDKIAPFAPAWHDANQLIPVDTIAELGQLGVFGLTTPQAFGGSEMGAEAMCVVTEELSRGYIGVGSLGTRSEIACELIRLAGTAGQKQRLLPKLASGEILPTAVFTEPNNGSDLANLTTRAERVGDVYRIFGAKTWITHASRTDMMILLARTGASDAGHRGLTMFLAEKPRGTEEDAFPAKGMSGSEINVLGYRGMREYELSFDGFEVPASSVLGGKEGEGFRQLMTTFELARIQTAARALGVAQNAFELGFTYACERIQFGKPLIEFPRVYAKLAWMAVEQNMVRQLVKSVARLKETGVRCDVEAGMAKLVAARLAWSCADNALQIHGGNGYAIEFPISRVLCDARILNIFEGAAEIQAHIIVRGMLGRAR